MLAFFLWPLLGAIVNSFHPYSLAGIDERHWTLANYRKLVDPFYLGVLWRTIRVSFLISAITAILAYPVAWYATSLRLTAQAALLMLYVAPWLVNVAVKAFGWTLLLGPRGLINRTLMSLGVIDTPLALMFNETGVVIGLLHAHFMFVLLPLWAALGGLDRNLLWAAQSLGASGTATFRAIVLPLTLPALLAGMVINFTINMAAFATPALLGGSRVQLVSYIAYRVNLVDLNWPLGAAMALVLLAVTLALVALSRRLGADPAEVQP
jgi:putative spermidine/putrescine transport system permease protein